MLHHQKINLHLRPWRTFLIKIDKVTINGRTAKIIIIQWKIALISVKTLEARLYNNNSSSFNNIPRLATEDYTEGIEALKRM